MPDLSLVHLVKAMQSFALVLQNEESVYAAYKLCGNVPVNLQSDKYFVYDTSFGIGRERTGTAGDILENVVQPGAEAPEIDWTLSSATYYANTYKLRDLVPDSEIAQADNPIQPVQDSMRFLRNHLLNDVELAFAKQFLVPGNYNAANYTTLTTGGAGTSWARASYGSASSDPLGAIAAGVEAVKTSALVTPNTLALTGDVARVLADHPAVKNVLQYTSAAWLEGRGVPAKLRNLDIVIADSVIETAALGGTSTPAYTFKSANGSVALVCFVPPGGVAGKKTVASFLAMDMKSGTTGQRKISFRAYRDEKRAGWIIEGEVSVDFVCPCIDGSSKFTGAYLIDKAIC